MAAPRRHRPLLLELDLTAAPVEVEPDDVVGRVRTRTRPRLRGVLRALHEAGDDPAVRGLVVKVGRDSLSWALVQELRAGLLAFGSTGKPTVAWAESLDAPEDYVLATGCGQVWLQESGELGLTGVASEVTFLRGALDKLGVEPQIGQRYEYKSAADVQMRREFSPAHREAAEAIVESIWTGAVDAISTARRLPADDVRAIADRAPLSATEARDAGLIDRLGYRDEVYADLRQRLGGDVQLRFADQWRPRRKAASLVRRRRGHVALVDGHGAIVSGRSRQTLSGRQMGSDTISAALRAARRSDDVRAVVFRVDSPGGSAVASDTIWREVALVREAGKPVVVSMGDVAGSGGYYVACGADAIVAQPATITGSIGVLGGKAVVSGLLERLGLGTGAVSRGRHARMFSARERFSDSEQERLDAMLDRVYREFVQKVADGRGLSWDAVHEVARGRIWTGADARERGLVDTLGGLRDAVDLARQRADLRADSPLRPALHVPPLARLGRPRSSEDPRAIATTTGAWGDLAGIAAALGLPEGGPLTMPSFTVR